MPAKVILPKFGQTVETSEITQWLKREGEAVRKGDVLCEIATDKSSLEVEAPADGTLLKILLPTQRTAPVGCVIALLGQAGETIAPDFLAACEASLGAIAAATPAPPATPPTPVAVPARSAPPSAPPPPAAPAPAAVVPTAPAQASLPTGRIAASPRARRAAEQHQVPLQVLTGTGEHGRITEADVLPYVAEAGRVTPTARAAAHDGAVDLRALRAQRPPSAGRITLADVASGESTTAAPVLAPLIARTEAATPMRRAIAQAMSQSAAEIPAFSLECTVEADAVAARRAQLKAAGVTVGFGDYIARAVALSIHAHPIFAAQWRSGQIVYHDRVDIAFAVAVPGGLVTPVVRDVSRRTIVEIAAESARLVGLARGGKLKTEDYTGGLFTLSNLGGFLIDRFVAIVPPGQSGILAIGRIRDEVAVRGGGLFPAKRMSLTLSGDHRYIDGADGAAFLATLKGLLEAPARLEAGCPGLPSP